MTEITLRAYIREIDSLIEGEKLDEAIAHCRHLLQRHPKYIECYRLLGKAYLEAKRFGDAADIFQRVLSTVPDDFVSHIGMSIVREDEGNLDSAIWHMERAFETNPANPAIQQELKRLIGRRDGFEPHKVRLTRGALARMYAHGELYPQAIAELQSALDEHSDRPDLQVLLARLLWQTEQHTDAAEVSSLLLEKLPYCLQATRIMAAVLQERGKLEDAAAYHRRLAQLDPYMAYTESPMAQPVRVDADSIMVQKLEWKPGQPLPSSEAAPADWAASLGLDEEGVGPGTGPLPSWLNDVDADESAEGQVPAMQTDEEDQPAPEPSEALADELPEAAAATEASGGDIPDWMQDAGWQESSGELEEKPVSFSSEELDQLERGELPAESPDSAEETGDLEPAEIPSWLQGMAPGEAEGTEADDAELEAILRSEAEPAELSDDLEAESDLEPLPEGAQTAEGQDVPGWLDEGEPGATNTIMTWLGDRESSEEAAPEAETLPEPEEADEVPSWLSGVAQAAADSESAEESELAQFKEQTSQLQEEEEEFETELTDSGDVPDWIQSITGEPEASDELSDSDLEAMVSEAEADLPWEAEVEAAEQDTIPQAEVEAGGEAEEPSMAAAPEGAPVPDGTVDADEEEADEEDWLAGLGEETVADEEGVAEEASWLEDLSGEQESGLGASAGATAPGWMEGLAEEEAGEDEVEARASTWLDDLSDTLADTPAEPGADLVDEPLDFLEQGEQEEPSPVDMGEDTQPVEEEEDLSWLSSMEAEQSQSGLGDQAQAPASAAEFDEIDEEGVFDWIDQMAAQQDQQPADSSSFEQDEVEAAPQVSQEAPPETIEEGLDWLDKLSETRGIDADIEREPAAGTISGRLASERPQEASQPEPEPPAPDDSSLWEPEIPGQTAEPAGLDSGEYEPAAAEPVSDEEVPTWLLAGAEEPDQPAESLDEFAAEPEEDVPSWLLDQGEQFEAEPTMEQPTAPAPTEAPPAPSMETEPEADDEVPAWLYATEDEESEPEAPAAEAAEATPAPPPPAQQPPAAEEAEEVPDWLKSQVQAESTQAEPASQPVEPPTPVEPAEPEPAAQAVEPPTPAEPAEPEPTLPAIEQPTPLEPAEAEPAPQPVQPPTPVESAEAAPAPQAAEQPSTVEPVEPEPTAEVEPEVEPAETTAAQEVVEAAAEPAESQPAAAEQPTPVQPATAEQPPAPTEAPEPEPAAALPAATEDPLAAARQALAQNDDQKAAADLSARVKDRSHLEEIVRLLEGHLEQEPDSPLLWQVLGDAYMRQNRTEQAVRAYDRGMEESEVFDSARQALAAADFERATAQYGMLIKNKKRLDTVIEDLEQAVEGDQSDPRIWQILGDAYMKADRLDESIEAYRKGMDSV